MKAKLTLLGIIAGGLLSALTFGQVSQPGQVTPAPRPTGNPCSFTASGSLTGAQLTLLASKIRGLEGEAEEAGFTLEEVCETATCLANNGIHGTIYARKYTKES
jgi:hypothetical protein